MIPTDDEIRKEVYSETFQMTSDTIEGFIKGMIYMRDKWIKVEKPLYKSTNDNNWIFERDGEKIYRRKFGADPSTRELI